MGRIITMWGVKTLNPVLDESSKEVKWTLMTGIRVVDELFEDEYEEIKSYRYEQTRSNFTDYGTRGNVNKAATDKTERSRQSIGELQNDQC